MTSSQEKRPLESSEQVTSVESTPEVKKQHTDNYHKGVAAIKSEYLITSSNDIIEDFYNDDEAEGGDREQEQPQQKGRRKRGQNKKRDLKQKPETLRLCSTLLDPENVRECSFGADQCRNTHNVEEYLASKPEDIDGVCPVFKTIGYCPTGLKCRWLKSHYVKETGFLIRDDERLEQSKQEKNYEVNKIDPEAKNQLRKKIYKFEISDPVIKYLDSVVKNDENLARMEENKNSQASYVEAPFKIAEKKKINLRNAKIVSPLTTVGNLPYRRLMKTLGADITYSEMALSIPLIQGNNSEWALPKAHATEYPGFGVQIATAKHYSAAKAAETIYKHTSHVSELNLNCGCPIDLLYRQGQGSALLDQPAKLLRIIKGMNASSGDIPVTVKIRTGTKDGKNTAINLVERILAENDVAAITLHGRSRQQRYTREADWNYIGEVGQVVKKWNEKKEDDKEGTDTQPTYFVGNGDVFTHLDWYNGVNTDGIDSVMVARGALIKPWIFEEVEAQQYLDKSATERLEILRKFADFAIEHWGSDEYGVGLARRFMCEFLGFTHRYIPVGILERLPPKINERPPKWKGRNELETLLASTDYKDWIKITEMFLGRAGDDFQFTPKHKSNSYES
ncbi:DUS3 [[Candida] subhashii]|uniref:tRNA-dihydrouridine(47) synthase [NAD(P)(+)] n=1 Tax=[Candida] subhashii TaxID=561895 RepID=A0A8J5R4P2_9ASCO|nr:DUS3 [[Candida] subhashii]KAG7665350.1 DUS3 [[Candida] subhashii]